MKIQFYKFSKKTNSTKQPDSTTLSFGINCNIRDSSSMHTPTVTVNLAIGFNPFNYNYAYIEDLQRYYFVNDWIFESNLWTAVLAEDVLASFKTEIGNTSAYVLRSYSSYNGRVTDSTYPTLANIYTSKATAASPFKKKLKDGCYIVGILNGEKNSIGAVSYYVFTDFAFRQFSNILFSSTTYMGTISDISDGLLKTLVNPFQYVTSCVWLPLSVDEYSILHTTAVTSIPIGWWTIDCAAYMLPNDVSCVTGFTGFSNLPKNPWAATRGEYLRLKPYTQYYIDFPPFGNFDIDPQYLIDSDSITLDWRVDLITGNARIALFDDISNSYFTIINAQLGVSISLASAAMNVVQTPHISSFLNDLGEQLQSGLNQLTGTNNSWLGNLGNSLNNAVGVVSNISLANIGGNTSVQTIGCNGGVTAAYFDVTIVGRFLALADEDFENKGRPLCAIKTLNTLTGFIQCSDRVFQNNRASSQEIETINNYLQGGFYYE